MAPMPASSPEQWRARLLASCLFFPHGFKTLGPSKGCSEGAPAPPLLLCLAGPDIPQQRLQPHQMSAVLESPNCALQSVFWKIVPVQMGLGHAAGDSQSLGSINDAVGSHIKNLLKFV